MESDDWNGLISPDAYEYLDLTPEEDLLRDSLLEEQDLLDEADEEPSLPDNDMQDSDDSDMYAHNSLFDEDDEDLVQEIQEQIPEEDADEDNVYGFGDSDDSDESYGQMSELIASIVSMLPPYNACTSYLKECGRDVQEDIAGAIKKAGQAWKRDGRDKMFTIPGTAITVALVGPGDDPMVLTQRLESVGAVMLSHNADKWTALFLTPGDDGLPERADVREISEGSFTQGELKTAAYLAQRMKKTSGGGR